MSTSTLKALLKTLLVLTGALFTFSILFHLLNAQLIRISDAIQASAMGSTLLFISLTTASLLIGSRFLSALRRQRFSFRASWVLYALLVMYSILFVLYSAGVTEPQHWRLVSVVCTVGFLSLLYFFAKNPERKREVDYLDQDTFAAGAVDRGKDEYAMDTVAQGYADVVQSKDNDYVTVIKLSGAQGDGKSSLLRMMIEHIPKEERLYTYISLTETNEEHDFNRLFANRWFATLNKRYPLIKIDGLEIWLKPILGGLPRGSLWSALLGFGVRHNIAIFPTKAKAYDDALGAPMPTYVEEAVARMFGNISEFNEDIWIIAIDEIDRARLQEVYRVIEVIERLKQQGRTGLPLKMIIILLVDDIKLKGTIELQKNTLQEAELIRGFMFESPKSFSYVLGVPPAPFTMKLNAVVKRLRLVAEKYNLDVNLEREDTFYPTSPVSDNLGISGGYVGIPMAQRTYDYLVHKLASKPKRFLERYIRQLDTFYLNFRLHTKGEVSDLIRFSDVALGVYVQLEYPLIIRFLYQTLDVVEASVGHDENSAHEQILQSRRDGQTLREWISRELGVNSEELPSEDELRKIFKAIFYAHIWYGNIFSGALLDLGKDTLSQPYNLRRFLSSGMDDLSNASHRAFYYYKQHERLNLSELSNKYLYELVQFVLEENIKETALLLRLADELVQRAVKAPRNITFFHANLIVRLHEAAAFNNEIPEQVKGAILSYLNERKIPLGWRVRSLQDILTNGFNEKDEVLSGTSLRLVRDDSALQRLLNEARKVLDSTTSIYTKDYYPAHSILYALWDGSPNSALLPQIHKIGARRLGLQPEIIDYYWSLLPDSPPSQGKKVSSQLGVYIDLSDLIKISRRHKRIFTKSEKIQQWSKATKKGIKVEPGLPQGTERTATQLIRLLQK